MPDEALSAKDLEIRDLRKESQRYRQAKNRAEEALAAMTTDRDALKGQVTSFEVTKAKAVEDALRPVIADRDAFKAKAETTPDEWRGKYEGLIVENRARDHKEAFRKLAEAQDVNPEAIDDAWELATTKHGYKPEGDKPDEARIKGAVGEVLKTRPYLLKPKADPSDPAGDPAKNAPDGQTQANLTASAPGPGIGRGTAETGKPATTVAQQVDRAFAATGQTHWDRL